MTKTKQTRKFASQIKLNKSKFSGVHKVFHTLYTIKNIEYFAKGHRGILYTGNYKGKKVVIKKKLPESKAVKRMENEAKWLKILNKYNIGPKLIGSGKDYFFYKYVDGEFIVDYVENCGNKSGIIKIIKDVYNQCFKMDKLNVDKEEMHHPVKHVIIGKKVVFLDFERCHEVKKGKNVTQFCQFLINKRFNSILRKKGIRISKKDMIIAAKNYKNKQIKKNLDKILRLIV
ncbi:MAG: hypothetical protein KAU20_06360 [Nanoarchaeota archaeon]|nr:hypothetical protein [Nanoarchaeota archaeon]